MPATVRKLVGPGIAWLLAGAGVFSGAPAAADSEPQAVALMYHHVGVGEHPSTNVTIEQFERHLAYLAENDFRVMALPDIVEAIRSGEDLPPRTVAITFDDAYRSVYTEAFPRLSKRGWPFTVFVSTGSVGGGSFMSWEQMREMGRAGVRFANHSHSHDYLIRQREGEGESAWMARVREDIERAQAEMEKALPESATTTPKLFAYPFGEYNQALADWLADQGYIAFGQHSGALGVHTDWRAAPRYPVNERYAEMEGFARKVASMPMPVAAERPFDPVVSGRNPPRLEVELTEAPKRWRELRCYSDGDVAPVEWLEDGRRFRVQAGSALPEGRSRYNCTVPVDSRFRWYSHLWIVP